MVQAVVEYARQQPRNFARGLWRKAQYTLGWFEAIRPQAGTSIFYIVTWTAALVGIALLGWIGPGRSVGIVWIPLIVAASHFAVVVLFQPHVYGDRLLMPFYMLIVPYAAIPVIAAARVAVGVGRQRAATVAWALLYLMLIARLLGRFIGWDVDVFAVAALVAGLCLAGLPDLRGFRVAIYAAYAIALAMWLVRIPDAGRGVICRWEWLFLAIALFSEALLPAALRGAAAGPIAVVGIGCSRGHLAVVAQLVFRRDSRADIDPAAICRHGELGGGGRPLRSGFGARRSGAGLRRVLAGARVRGGRRDRDRRVAPGGNALLPGKSASRRTDSSLLAPPVRSRMRWSGSEVRGPTATA